ncbi:MAG TPA: glycosyltransferase [Phycisphaerales bacterium]|nr:glycosyltransferase [Phycisphaerales bacterium]
MPSPLRILHYLPSLDPRHGGPIRAVQDLSSALSRRGHAVTISTSELPPKGLEKANAAPGPAPALTIEFLGEALVKGAWMRAASRDRVRMLLRDHDLLHVHGTWDVSNAQLGRLARSMKKPYFVSVRGMLDDWCMAQKAAKKRVFLALAGRRHLERAASVHLTADFEFDQARKWFPNGRGVVIPNLLELAPFRALPGPGAARAQWPALAEGEPVILFLSRVHIKKGVDVLLLAFSLLRKRGVRAKLVIAGSGEPAYEQEMKELAASLGVGDAATFTGHVGGPLKLSLYEAAAVMAMPTSQENFGFVFPESLACGTPVVTTKGVDIWPQLERSGAALIVERTPEAFADAIEKLLADPARLAAMREKARPFVFSEYDEERLLDAYEKMYRGE